MTLRTVRISTVQREHVSWLWEGRIPAGKLTILDGDPGLGKSTMTMDLAARVTTDRPMPDGTYANNRGAWNVLILTAEDGLGDTIRPRLEAAGADVRKVIAVDAAFDLEDDGERLPEIPRDTAALEELISMTDAKLVIIDPLMAYLGGEINSYRDQDTRRVLSGVKGVAERTGAAVLVVRHLTKGGGTNGVYRGGGSIGIIGAARSGLLVAKDPDDETGERCILVSTKSNLGPPPPALAYRIVGVEDTSRVQWEGATEHTAAGLLALPDTEDQRTARAEAEDFLTELLANGPMLSIDLLKEAKAAGIAEATLRRAKKTLDVDVYRQGGIGGEGRWLWELNAKVIKNTKDDHAYGVNILGKSDHLRPVPRELPVCWKDDCRRTFDDDPDADYCPEHRTAVTR